MKHSNRTAIAALAAAGILWGTTVPLSKLALAWLDPAWLTVVRFTLAAPLLGLVARRELRRALSWRVVGSGALGFGGVVILQSAGVAATSVSHAAVLLGSVPVLVALMTLGRGQARPRLVAWAGYALALLGVALIASGGGSGASPRGDLLVLASAILSAAFIAVQPGLLEGRDAAAVTAVQFAAAGLAALPVALLQGVPHLPASFGAAPAATLALVLVGTPLPFWLFAYGQSRVSASLAGAFVNLEPLVGAVLGWIAFGNQAGLEQLLGGGTVLAGVLLSAVPPSGWSPAAQAASRALSALRSVLPTGVSGTLSTIRTSRGYL